MIRTFLKHELTTATTTATLRPLLSSLVITQHTPTITQQQQQRQQQQQQQRCLSTTTSLDNKRKWYSKWKRQLNLVHTKVDDPGMFKDFAPERCFDKILNYQEKNKLWRRRLFKRLLSDLVAEERIITTVGKGIALARLSEHLIECGKRGDTPAIENLGIVSKNRWKLETEYLPRFKEQDGPYMSVYRCDDAIKPHFNPTAARFYRKQQQMQQDPENPRFNWYTVPNAHGLCIVEFKGNKLEPLVPGLEELKVDTLQALREKRERKQVKHVSEF